MGGRQFLKISGSEAHTASTVIRHVSGSFWGVNAASVPTVQGRCGRVAAASRGITTPEGIREIRDAGTPAAVRDSSTAPEIATK